MLIPGHYPFSINILGTAAQRYELWVEKPSGEQVHLSSVGSMQAVGVAFSAHAEEGNLEADDRFGLLDVFENRWLGPALDDRRYPPEAEAERGSLRASGYHTEDDE